MRAFLSHSSNDKGYVEAVSTLLRPGTFELDSQTFDLGLINSETIINSLKRSDLFCLFLSEKSIQSPYVNFETLIGSELYARGTIKKFLVICIDDVSFNSISENIKLFNIARKCNSIESSARLIQGNLISAANLALNQSHPFVGRENEIVELEKQTTDHSRPLTKAIFISGNFGSGRRSLAKKFYQNQYPEVNSIFPEISIEQFFGQEEIHRKILYKLRPSMTVSELKTRIQSFTIAPAEEKNRIISQLLNTSLASREAIILIDDGGILNDDGKINIEIDKIMDLIGAAPHPPVVIIAPRMIPAKLRRRANDLAYLPLRSLDRDSSERLILKLLKDNNISTYQEKLNDIISISENHPYNIYRMIEEISERGIDPFLANPSDFIEWKHRYSSEYLEKIDINKNERLILGLLKIIPELDFSAIASALPISDADISESLLKLMNLHVLESSSETFVISPALRVAVEKDGRISIPKNIRNDVIKSVSESLSVRIEEGNAVIALIDSAILSNLEISESVTGIVAAFLMPSHYVWLSKRKYDRGNYRESIRLAKEALKGISRLSSNGLVAAGRFLCLSASRLGDQDTFDYGIKVLSDSAKEKWERSNVAYLKGFNLRFKGNIIESEKYFRESYQLSPGNTSAGREIAAICLARGNLEDAEIFAREAHSHAQRNAYLIDILISVLIRRYGKKVKTMSEVEEMFSVLEKVGEEGGKSFFTTRKAEFEHLWGDNRTALNLINNAISKTPKIFETRRLRCEILLKDGQKIKASEELKIMNDMVSSRDPEERRTNYRSYLETKSHYLVEIGSFKEAKEIYDDIYVFTSIERKEKIKEIEIIQGYKSQ